MIDRIQRIYERLEDDQSKYIFLQRLLFSISGEKKYITQMVENEIMRYKSDDQMYNLIKWFESRSGKNIVFGGGFAGYQIIEVLKCFNISVDAICDNNSLLWGTIRYGVQVISPNELAKLSDANVVVGVNSGVQEITEQLKNLGITQNVYIPAKEWWLGKYKQYFDTDIIRFVENEVFVDGGALDGQDTINFFNLYNKTASAILFEPDYENFKKTELKMKTYSGVNVLQRGLWDGDSIIRFNAGDKENSSVSMDGDIEIKTMAIDDIETNNPITFIKMDIEGSESRALEGARNTIVENKPKLAICVYHKPEDILELPLMILEMNPHYKLYLRHYSYTKTETVLYAVSK